MYQKILLHLKELDASSIGIEASALISIDGLVMVATLPLDIDVENFGAICAGAFLLGHHTSLKCEGGMLEQVLIKCAKRHIVITYAGPESILAVIIQPYANLDQLFSGLARSIEKITMIV